MLRTSTDDGKSWSDAKRLPQGILGPIKDKPVQLADGTLLVTWLEGGAQPGLWLRRITPASELGGAVRLTAGGSPRRGQGYSAFGAALR